MHEHTLIYAGIISLVPTYCFSTSYKVKVSIVYILSFSSSRQHQPRNAALKVMPCSQKVSSKKHKSCTKLVWVLILQMLTALLGQSGVKMLVLLNVIAIFVVFEHLLYFEYFNKLIESINFVYSIDPFSTYETDIQELKRYFMNELYCIQFE